MMARLIFLLQKSVHLVLLSNELNKFFDENCIENAPSHWTKCVKPLRMEEALLMHKWLPNAADMSYV